MSKNLEKYTLVLVKNNCYFDGWKTNLNDVKDMVEIIFEGIVSYDEAISKFNDLIHKQLEQRKKTHDAWRRVALYNAQGKQIAQES